MTWEKIDRPVRNHSGVPGMKFSDKYNTSINRSLFELLPTKAKFLIFEIGKGEHEGLISFALLTEKAEGSHTLSKHKTGANCLISCSPISKMFGLHKEFIVFKKEGDRFVGELPKANTLSITKVNPNKLTTQIIKTETTTKPENLDISPVKITSTQDALNKSDLKPRTTQIIKPKPEPPPKPVVEKPPPTKPDVVSKVNPSKVKYLINFRKVNECRLSKSFSDFSKNYTYIKIEKTHGVKQLRVHFSEKPGSDKFVLKRYSTGTHFSAVGFLKLYGLDGKSIEFERDERNNFFYGDIL